MSLYVQMYFPKTGFLLHIHTDQNQEINIVVNYKPYSDFTNYSYDILIENSDHSAFSSGLKFFWI